MYAHQILKSSVVVSISGAFKLYVAFLLLGIEPDFTLCLGAALIIYSTYTLDRALDEIEGKKATLPVLSIIFFAFLASLYIFKEKVGISPVIFPFAVGFAYTKGLKINGRTFRLKGGLGSKNFVVALTWAGFLVLILRRFISGLAMFFVWQFFFFKSFINTVIFDIKDIEQDRKNRIFTLPVVFGTKSTRNLLIGMHILCHVIMLAGYILGKLAVYEILIFSYIYGLIYIIGFTGFTKNKSLMSIFVDGEWTILSAFLALQQKFSLTYF